jgi:hypothetical protein
MGRELALQLAAMGCDVAVCDVFPDTMAETKPLCLSRAWQGGSEAAINISAVRKLFAVQGIDVTGFPTIRSGRGWRRWKNVSGMARPRVLTKRRASSSNA